MAVSRDIVRTYRSPARVVRELLAMGQREDRAIAWLMIGCLLAAFAGMPIAQRDVVMNGGDIQQRILYLLFSSLLLLPLCFYLLAGIVFAIIRPFRPAITGYGARLALFWGWLALTPLMLFYGLLAGMNGAEHSGTVLVQWIGIAVALWFWITGLIEVSKAKT